MNTERVVNLPGVLHGKNFRKFKMNEDSVVTSNDRYLGISKAKSHYATFRPFSNLRRIMKNA